MRHGIALALAAWWLGTLAYAAPQPPVRPPSAGPDSTASRSAAAAADAAADPDAETAALALAPLDTRMAVEVRIDGAGPYRFLVDSGASRTVISRELADRLALPGAGRATLHSLGGTTRVDLVRIRALDLGGMATDALVAPVLDARNLGGPAILGIDALAGTRVTIDLVADRMTIARARRHAEAPAADEIVVTARRRYGQLILADADVGGEHIYAVIDSGAMTTIGNPVLEQRLTRRHRAEAQPVTIVDIAGHATAARQALLDDVRIGALHLHDVPVAFADAHAFRQFGLTTKPAMLLGMDVLHAFRRVSIDFGSRSVRFLVDGSAQSRLAAVPGKRDAASD